MCDEAPHSPLWIDDWPGLFRFVSCEELRDVAVHSLKIQVWPIFAVGLGLRRFNGYGFGGVGREDDLWPHASAEETHARILQYLRRRGKVAVSPLARRRHLAGHSR